MGAPGGGRDSLHFWQPNDVLVAPNGTIFVAEGHSSSAGAVARVLKFSKDGKLVYKAGPITYTGTYSLGIGDTVTLNLDQELSGRKRHSQKIVINGDKLTMSDTDGTSLSFQKVQ